jgi:uncharacterized protein YndB with AHSA1/START domain
VNTSLDVEIREEIERPLADVWAMVSDATRLPQWLEEFEHVVQESEGPVGKGTVFRYTLSPGPGERSAPLEWVDWQPERRLAWDGPPLRSFLGGARPRGSFELSALGPTKTLFISRYQPQLTGLLVFMRPLVARFLKRQRTTDTQRLKRILEADDGMPTSQ